MAIRISICFFWSSLGTLGLLIAAAVQENFLREWRQICARSRPMLARWRCVSAKSSPTLGVTDRCVTCHVGMVPGEQGVRGILRPAAHPPVSHDPAEFGCTVCHGGQDGQRTRPTPTGRFTSAGADDPYAMRMPVAEAATPISRCRAKTNWFAGRNLVERHDCLACHRIDGRGGTLRPGGTGGMEGPDLSKVGVTGFDQDWHEKHLQRARQPDHEAWKADSPRSPPWIARRLSRI